MHLFSSHTLICILKVFSGLHIHINNTFLVHNNFDICTALSSAYRSQLQTPIPFPLKVMKPKRTSSLHKICFTNHIAHIRIRFYVNDMRIVIGFALE